MTLQELLALIGDGVENYRNGPVKPVQLESFRTTPYIEPGLDGTQFQGPPTDNNKVSTTPVKNNSGSSRRGKKPNAKNNFLKKVTSFDPMPQQDIAYDDIISKMSGIDADTYGGGSPGILEMTDPNYGMVGVPPNALPPKDAINYVPAEQPDAYGTRPPPPIQPYITDEIARAEAKKKIDEIYGANLSNESFIQLPNHRRWEAVLDTAVKMALGYSAGGNIDAAAQAGSQNVIQQFTRPERYQQMIQTGTDIERERLEKRRTNEMSEDMAIWARDEGYAKDQKAEKRADEELGLKRQETAANIRQSDAAAKLANAQAEDWKTRADRDYAEIEAKERSEIAKIKSDLAKEARERGDNELKLLIEQKQKEEDLIVEQMKGTQVPAAYDALNKRLQGVRADIRALGAKYGFTGQGQARQYGNVGVDKKRIHSRAAELAMQKGADQNEVNEDIRKVESGQMPFEEFRKKYGI